MVAPHSVARSSAASRTSRATFVGAMRLGWMIALGTPSRPMMSLASCSVVQVVSRLSRSRRELETGITTRSLLSIARRMPATSPPARSMTSKSAVLANRPTFFSSSSVSARRSTCMSGALSCSHFAAWCWLSQSQTTTLMPRAAARPAR